MTTDLSRKRFALTIVLTIAALAAPPAFAVNKDMVQLQTQVQELQDAVARLQQSNDERMGVLKDLIQQSADSVNKMSAAVDALQQQMRTQQETASGKLDQVSGQVQALNDSLDEVKARLNNLEKALQAVQNQQQSINATLQNLATPPAASAPGTEGTPSPGQTVVPASVPPAVTQPAAAAAMAGGEKPSGDVPFPATQGPPPTSRSAPVAPPVGDLYKTALGDYMAAKYTLASNEFAGVVRAYPDNALSGNAYYYMGEIDYRAGKFTNAVKDYDHVLEQFPDNPKIAVSHLHKGQALFAMGQNEAGIREMRALITRFPNSPEATQARSRLSGMGVSAVPKPPA